MTKLVEIHKKYIRGTEKKAPIYNATFLICNLSKIVLTELGFETVRVYSTTRALKHIYDKRIAQEYDFLLSNIIKIIKKPDRIYQNVKGKTGDLCFYKSFDGEAYFCVVEKSQDKNPDDGEIGMNYLVSAYKLNEEKAKRERYLANYKLLWSWEGDNPPS